MMDERCMVGDTQRGAGASASIEHRRLAGRQLTGRAVVAALVERGMRRPARRASAVAVEVYPERPCVGLRTAVSCSATGAPKSGW